MTGSTASYAPRPSRRGLLTGVALVSVAGLTGVRPAAAAAKPAPAATGLAVTTGNTQLVADFTWARQRALDWVQTGKKPGYIPCYWAGLTTRPAFYSRDFAHQALGAHLLGLDAENLSMLRSFANSATAARKWYPLWSFTFDGRAYSVDYKSDTNFVREVPAVFELTQKGVEQYLWTGNRAYIDDAVLFGYYTNSVNAFVTAHDDNRNGIADEDGTGSIFKGVVSYNENREKLLEAGDAVGSQYQALRAYAVAQAARGDNAGAAASTQRAEALKAAFEKNWYSATARRYIRGFNAAGPLTNFGKENSWFMPMKEITAPGARTDGYLDFVDSSVAALPPFNIEAYTYLPETFFRWGRVEQAWKWLRYVGNSRAAYPEVSYTVIGNIVEGLLGVRPNAPAAALATLAHLPSAVPWLRADHIRLGAHDLAVHHVGAATSTVTHHSGPRALTWTARFAGRHTSITVNGQPRAATVQTVGGRVVSSVDVTVEPGSAATAAV
jgi:hypothetical protein